MSGFAYMNILGNRSF